MVRAGRTFARARSRPVRGVRPRRAGADGGGRDDGDARRLRDAGARDRGEPRVPVPGRLERPRGRCSKARRSATSCPVTARAPGICWSSTITTGSTRCAISSVRPPPRASTSRSSAFPSVPCSAPRSRSNRTVRSMRRSRSRRPITCRAGVSPAGRRGSPGRSAGSIAGCRTTTRATRRCRPAASSRPCARCAISAGGSRARAR